MLVNRIKFILLQFIIICSLVTVINTDAKAGFVAVDPTKGYKFPDANPFPNIGNCDVNEWKVYTVNSSTMFNPKIKVHNRLVVACFGWEGDLTLDAYGECNFIGLTRVCARVTPPCEYGNDRGCDLECDPDTYANGNTDLCPNANNPCCDLEDEDASDTSCPTCSPYAVTRTCVFNDTMAPVDINDFNAYSMPSHKKSDPPPGESLGEQSGSAADSTVDWMNDTGIMPPGMGAGGEAAAKAVTIAGGILDYALELTGINYVNSTVCEDNATCGCGSKGNCGCVPFPHGPSPPPFCSPIIAPVPAVKVYNICQSSPEYEFTDNGGTTIYTQISTSEAGQTCEISSSNGDYNGTRIYSSFENPLVRVSFSNQLDACGSSDTTSTVDNCVQINTSADAEDIWYDNKNILPICSSSITSNCVSFNSGRDTGALGSSTDSFRAYYIISNPSCSSSSSENVLYAEYPESSSGEICNLEVSGIYDNQYEDISYGSNNIGEVVEVTDYTERTREVTAKLNNDTGDGMSLCVTEKKDDGTIKEIDCVPRPSMFRPEVSECLDNNSCYYDNSSVIYEQPRISFNVGYPIKTGIIGVELALDDGNGTTLAPTPFCVLDEIATTGYGTSTSNPSPCQIYYAKVFDSYVTDQYNVTSDASPTGDGTITPYASGGSYTGGIQYTNSVYCRGASKICLTGYVNQSRKVVAKMLLQNDQATVSNDIRDRIIPPYVEGQESLDNAVLFDPNIHYWYGNSTNSYTAIGSRAFHCDSATSCSTTEYDYFENSACNSTSNFKCTAPTPTVDNPTSTTCQSYSDTQGWYDTSNAGCEWAFIQDQATTTNTYQGYTYNGINYPLENSSGEIQYGERTLNSLEDNLCVDIEIPYCNAVSPGDNSVDGYAQWPQTSVNGDATGTCVAGKEENSSGPPTRKCIYKDDGTFQVNGCPNYTIAWDNVANPCVTIAIPEWWPGEFLVNRSKLQGAIFNQFNVMHSYQSRFRPKAANYDPFVNAYTVPNMGYSPFQEYWVTTGYNSCKRYTNYIDINRTRRNSQNGDQEMLYLTQAQWQDLWNNNDMSWLLATPTNKDDQTSYTEYDGCYVYELGKGANATADIYADISGGVVAGMKICKYENKVSFSLVDLSADNSLDYTNNSYIMQSNLVAFDQWNTGGVTPDNPHNLRDESFYPNTQVTTSNLPGGRQSYEYYTHHGIVVDRWTDDSDNIVIGTPPFPSSGNIRVPESVQGEYSFVGYYYYDTSGGRYHYDTVDPSPGFDARQNEHLDNYISRMSGGKLPVDTHDCALKPYRKNINYANSIDYLTYFPKPFQTPDNDASISSFISRMYVQTVYNGNNKDNGRRQTECGMRIKYRDYVSGNSAANPSMFLWTSKDNYRRCND